MNPIYRAQLSSDVKDVPFFYVIDPDLRYIAIFLKPYGVFLWGNIKYRQHGEINTYCSIALLAQLITINRL